MSSAAPAFAFSSKDGQNLVRDIITDSELGYTPHDYQIEGVCKLLDGQDLIAVLPTGAGKTGYYTIYMLVLLALSREGSRGTNAPEVPKKPCMVMVYPTNGLEEEQAGVFKGAGIDVVVINADTSSQARQSGQDLWTLARQTASMILLSPEQLTTANFESLLQGPEFQRRVCALGVDEVHLLNSWGQQFRKAYQQLGHARARMPSHTRLVGTTATLLAGKPEEAVLSFLGLRPRQFHLIRRSNLRSNVRTIRRTLKHSLMGWEFPDLKWVIVEGRKTVIHCRTIMMGFRVAAYLLRLCPSSPDRSKRVRLYNSLNWPDYNSETRRLMQHDPSSQIIIATAAFMVGIDLPNVADVIILGALQTADEFVQWQGRAGRDPRLVSDPRCFILLAKQTYQTARALCAGKPVRRGEKKSKTPEMDLSMARLLCADCISVEQNKLYANPSSDPLCSCPTCCSRRSASPLTSAPSTTCLCSGPACMPEDDSAVAPRLAKHVDNNPIPRAKRITRAMRAVGLEELELWRDTTYLTMNTARSRALPAEFFVPDSLLKMLLDRFATVDSEDALRALIGGEHDDLIPYVHSLWLKLEELGHRFTAMCRPKSQKSHGRAVPVGKTTFVDDGGDNHEEYVMYPHRWDSLANVLERDRAESAEAPATKALESAMFTFQVEMSTARPTSDAADMEAGSSALLEWDYNDPNSDTKLIAANLSGTAMASTSRKRSRTTFSIPGGSEPHLHSMRKRVKLGKENTAPMD